MIRIIAGKHRSRLINTPSSEVVLPTKNMVREAIFSILGLKVNNAVVLDLFAGSGALGLESLSRGAQKAYFCDCHPEPIKIVTENVKLLKEEDSSEVHLCDFNEMIDYLERNKIFLDIIFIDPPYESGYYEIVIDKLLALDILKAGGKLVVESRHEVTSPGLKNTGIRHYRYGQTHLLIVTK